MDRTCEICGKTFAVRNPNYLARSCSPPCRAKLAWRSKPAGRSHQMTLVPGHPLADARGRIGLHRVVLYEKIGPGTHPCHWCRTPVTWRPVGGPRRGALFPDHLNGDPRNNDPANLVPSCSGCNSRRGLPDRIGEDELTVVTGRKRPQRGRAERRRCQRCGREFLHRATKGSSPGLYCSRSCAGREKPRANAIGEGELFIVLPNGRRARAVEQQCGTCGKPFLVRAAVVKAGNGRYCSRACSPGGGGRLKINVPT